MPKVPENLTLVSSRRTADGFTSTVVVSDEEGHLRIDTTLGAARIPVHLTERQAKQLIGRINKFFRENR